MRDRISRFRIQFGVSFPADRIITHTLPLDEITTAFPLMECGESLKVCVYP